ncbi:hypothetical protein PYW08_009127 [Mythimna loreyi]|uniref:Uncharacterized protein n=1 Tax=Mythimna loreyi TaxID=667449 RepID=A0ACC2Q896_9NEOP|nr:hypothetical protein PYW08_009127 [Mythimna loreyi]
MWLLTTFILYLTIISTVKSALDYLQHPVKSCHVGDVVENTCNKCLCTSKTVFECTALSCNSTTTGNELEENEPVCVPNQLYVQNLITCICTKDGRWPHKSCKDTFQSLPPRNVITHTCKPDTYIPIDCNVCRCGPDGKILNERCTRNACEDDIQRRTSYMPTNTVFSKCEDKYWYSLAPCQFCFCVNVNKLVCNTGNYYTRNLDLGSYKLNVCGKDLIKEAIELIPESVRSLRSTNASKNEMQNPVRQMKTNEFVQKVPTNNMNIEFVPVNNDIKNHIQDIKSVNKSHSTDYYSEKLEAETQRPEAKWTPHKSRSVHTTSSTIKSTRDLPIVRVHVQNNAERAGARDVNTIEQVDDDESIGMELDFDPRPTRPNLRAHFEEAQPYDYGGETLKINIPKALNKVFQLAVRKSMVTLSKTSKCTPGATTVHECNMCFCLKNTKLLCTSHKCSGKKS